MIPVWNWLCLNSMEIHLNECFHAIDKTTQIMYLNVLTHTLIPILYLIARHVSQGTTTFKYKQMEDSTDLNDTGQ